MKTIQVKDGDWLAEAYGWNRVKVYVGETKAEHEARRKHEYDLIIYNRDNRYSGFDEFPETDDREEADLA
jgi:hypothetical protein